MIKIKREAGIYVVEHDKETVRVYRSGYAFEIAERLLRSQGIKSRSITKAVANTIEGNVLQTA